MANPMMDRYTNQTGGGGRKFDVKAEVVGYNHEAKTVKVRMSDNSAPVKEGYDPEVDVQISTYAPKASRPDADFEGNVIDQRMEGQIPVGDTVILEGLTLKANQNGPAPVRWINSAPGANPDKVVEGTFTASGIAKTNADGERGFEVTHLQQWSQKAMTPEAFFQDNMKAAFDEPIERHEARQNDPNADIPIQPNTGVSLRAVKDGQVIDYIPPVSYNREAKRPISFDEIKEGFEAYKAHIESAYGEGVSVEVVPVREYPVAPSSRDDMARSPAGSMVRTGSPLNESDNAPGIGNQTLSVNGTIALSPGKLNPRDGSRKGAENQWVTDAYFSARKNHIHDVIPDANGEKVEVSSVIREKMSYPSRQQEAPAEAKPADEPEPGPAEEADMESDEDAMLDNAFAASEQKASGPSMG